MAKSRSIARTARMLNPLRKTTKRSFPNNFGHVPSLLHDDNQWLILGSSAVHHKRLDTYADILVAGEVDEIRGDDSRFAGLKHCRSPSLDFYGKVSFDHMQQLLRTRMHVPRSRSAGPEVDDTDDRLLYDLALI